MVDCSEPVQVYPEKCFEEALAPLIQAALDSNPSATLVKRFGCDIAVFLGNRRMHNAFFIEVKSFGGQRQGGVGFGNGHGKGPQVELLSSSDIQLATLDKCVRWAFADATKPHGAARFAMLTCSEAKQCVMGGVRVGKQNNFGMRALRKHWIEWTEFCNEFRRFLSVGQEKGTKCE